MKIKSKGLTSLALACTFVVVATSGAALYISPKGRVANWTGWTLGGLTKRQWESLHLNMCIMMLAIVVFHLFFNWRVFWTYIRRRASGFNLKLEMATAVVVTTLVVVGTIVRVPPLTLPTAWGERIKAYWEHATPAGPAPHAEEQPLGRFARNMGLIPEDVVVALQKDGLELDDPHITVAELAERNHMTPAEIFAAIDKHFPEAASQTSPGAGPGRGFGQGRGQGSGTGQGSGMGKTQVPNDHDDAQDMRAGSGMGPGGGWARGEGGGPGRGRGMGMGGGSGRGQGQGQGPQADR